MNLVRVEASELARSSSFSTNMDRTTRHHDPHTINQSKILIRNTDSRRMSLQRLSLDSAVAPLLDKPTAPFDKTERKRAHTSALYYSECFLRGIKPVDADTAAMEAQGKYDKWWIQSTAACDRHREVVCSPEKKNHQHNRSSFQKKDDHQHHVRKWRRTLEMDDDKLDDGASAVSANVVSVISGSSLHSRRQASAKRAVRHLHGRDSQEEDEEDVLPVSISQISTLNTTKSHIITDVKKRLISDLKATGGNVDTKEFLECLEVLEAFYRSKSWDGRGSSKSLSPFSLEGNWLTLSKPTYNECKGLTERGEYTYSLGRMSFDMFKPTNLVCSMQATFNHVRPIDPKNPGRPLHVPKQLMKDIQKGGVNLRTYDIVVALTIEAGQDRKGVKKEKSDEIDYVVPRRIRGILTNQGYAVPDPNVPNRLSIWFSGGSLEVQDEPNDLEEWKRIFDATSAPDRDIREYANILAARLLLGALLPEEMEEDGTMSFILKRPIGGHGSAFCDIIYMDDDLRVMRGHHGSVYVCTRVPDPDLIQAM